MFYSSVRFILSMLSFIRKSFRINNSDSPSWLLYHATNVSGSDQSVQYAEALPNLHFDAIVSDKPWVDSSHLRKS